MRLKRRLINQVLAGMMIFSLIQFPAKDVQAKEVKVKSESIANAENEVSLGDYIYLGNYYNKPILWRCVDKDENGLLMLSDKIICFKAYDAFGEDEYYHNDGWGYIRKQYGSNCWEDSSIRQWLNANSVAVTYSHCSPSAERVGDGYNPYDTESGFLYNFENNEQNCIKQVTQIVHVNEWETSRDGYCDGGTEEIDCKSFYDYPLDMDYTKFYYKRCSDKIFLLNASQIRHIYNNFGDYIYAYPTEEAVQNNDEKSSEITSSKICPYRTSVPGTIGASFEHVETIPMDSNPGGAYTSCGIRPAFYLDEKLFSGRIYKERPVGISFFTVDSTKLGSVNKILNISSTLALSDSIESSSNFLSSEVSAIKWTSSDQSIVPDSEISCTRVNSSDSCSAELMISFTPYKKGKVTITGTTSNGLTASCEVIVGGCITIDQKANDLEGCTIALSGMLTLEELTEASEANLKAAVDALKFESSDNSKAKVLACNAVQSEDRRSAKLEIWTTLYNEGNVTITAKAPDGHKAECKVTIQADASVGNEDYEGDYTSEMRDFLTNKGTFNTLKYLCNSSNYTASTFVAEKDTKFGNLLVMSLTDTYYRGWDGWKDIIDGSTSVAEAEKILASLLKEYQREVEGLSQAKTAQKYAKIINNAFSDYIKSANLFKALNSEEIQVVRNYFSDENLAKLLYEGKYNEIVSPVNQILQMEGMNQIMQKSEVFQAGTEASKSWNKMMERFTQSAEVTKTLKKGCQSKLGKLEIGGGLSDIGDALNFVSLSQDALNYIYQIETLLTADEMYSEMLLYVKENCAYSVVQEAAGNLYSVINDRARGVTEAFKRFATDKLGEQALDLALQAASDSSHIFAIIKAGFDWGATLSNTVFKVGSAQELKDSLRSQAFLANTLGRWVLSKETEYISAIGTEDEALKAKEMYYSLYMAWESRKCAEETLQSLLKTTTGGEWSANYSVSARILSTLESFKDNIFSEGNMVGLFGISVSCPVDVEVCNAAGDKLLTVKDGAECRGYENGIYYYCVYNPLANDYDKYIYYSEDAGYRVKILGNDLGSVDASVLSVNDDGYFNEFYIENTKIEKGTVIALEDISKEDAGYKIISPDGSEKPETMDIRKAEKIATRSISLSAESLELEVGKKELLGVSFAPANATNQKVAWRSSNDAVVSVNSDGVITAVAAGTAAVTVSQGDLGQTCKITVKGQSTEYKIDYNLNGGSVSGNPANYTTDILPITLKNPVRSGYTFTGWTGSNGSTPQKTVTIAKGSTGNKSYTANWSKNQSAKTSIKKAKISLKKTSYVYNGKKKQPSVTVKIGSKKLRKGTDYKVTYKNNKEVGAASVVINGTGEYTGNATKKFKIVPKGTSISKVTAKPKGFVVSWRKQPKSSEGYQIQYSTSQKFTKKTTVTKTVKKPSKTKLDIKKCKAAKRYYVRIRTYKTMKGKKYCSGWSKLKSVVTKNSK